MMIINRQQRFWTFNTLICAFVDLFIAYFLLFGSTIGFFAANFLHFFGFSFPNFQNPNPQLKTLLVDYPTDKVSSVQFSVIRKFPFDSVFEKVQNDIVNDGLNLDRGERFREFEGEASCSSKSDARKVVRNENAGIRLEKERGFDMKGKAGLNNRLRGGFRRRRKGSFDSGKHSSVSSSSNRISCADQHKEHTAGPEGSSLLSGCNTDYYEAEDPMVVKSDSSYPQDIVFNNTDDTQKRIPVNEADKDKMIVLLTRELEEEQTVRAALYIELEKERNAAATAADEAMSMILRLQEEKASIEMESRQYQRMIEEKSAYDEEEMNILKEIVLRREREKHFLEKEVEAYRQMNHVENDQFYGTNNENSRGYEDVDFAIQEEGLPEKTIATVGEEKDSKTESGEDASNETDLRVYDVHVIDDKSDKSNRNKKPQPASSSETSVSSGLPPICSKSSLRRNSTSAIDNERTKLDTEVDWLRERLRIVQEGRDKLNFSIENREKESLQLQLLEDIARQLQEIRMLTQPRTSRQASLPLSSAKGATKRRRCRSASTGAAKSS